MSKIRFDTRKIETYKLGILIGYIHLVETGIIFIKSCFKVNLNFYFTFIICCSKLLKLGFGPTPKKRLIFNTGYPAGKSENLLKKGVLYCKKNYQLLS